MHTHKEQPGWFVCLCFVDGNKKSSTDTHTEHRERGKEREREREREREIQLVILCLATPAARILSAVPHFTISCQSRPQNTMRVTQTLTHTCAHTLKYTQTYTFTLTLTHTLQAHVIVLNHTLSALNSASLLPTLETLLKAILASERQNSHTWASAFGAYSDAGRPDLAIVLFQQACRTVCACVHI